MAKRGVKTGLLDRLSVATTQEIDKMDRKQLIDIYSSGSKTFNKRVRDTMKSDVGKYSTYLNRNQGSKIKEMKKSQLEKMTTTKLKYMVRQLSYNVRRQTTTISGTKAFMDKIQETTGRDVREFTSDDWAKIRKLIEEGSSYGYASDDIIAVYERDMNDKEMKKLATDRYDSKKDISTEGVSNGVRFAWEDDE